MGAVGGKRFSDALEKYSEEFRLDLSPLINYCLVCNFPCISPLLTRSYYSVFQCLSKASVRIHQNRPNEAIAYLNASLDNTLEPGFSYQVRCRLEDAHALAD